MYNRIIYISIPSKLEIVSQRINAQLLPNLMHPIADNQSACIRYKPERNKGVEYSKCAG